MAKNGTIPIDDTCIDYISFGRGTSTLVMLPGLSESLRGVKGTALLFSILYRKLARDFTVYLFGRRRVLPKDFSIADMARDVAHAMNKLAIDAACMLGVSQGGMIAQVLAIEHPPLVQKLVLAVTLSRPNDTVREYARAVIELAKNGNYKQLMQTTLASSYSERYLKKHKLLIPFAVHFGKPKNFDKFLVQAKACLHHDVYERLQKIQCPVLVIGGEDDRVVSAKASREIAEKIPQSELYLYSGLGHAAFDEARDFWERVAWFCKR
ncbi:MAG: alpha/beta hydrolase [Treponema sp.]|nr:alpha/beta hydrolase [Treponema sp.]